MNNFLNPVQVQKTAVIYFSDESLASDATCSKQQLGDRHIGSLRQF